MSGLEQRTKGRNEERVGPSAVTAVMEGPPEGASMWAPIDGDLLDERRAAVPAFSARPPGAALAGQPIAGDRVGVRQKMQQMQKFEEPRQNGYRMLACGFGQ
jgi:hypothetical protein